MNIPKEIHEIYDRMVRMSGIMVELTKRIKVLERKLAERESVEAGHHD